MLLDDPQTIKIINFLDKKWPEPRTCPVCNHDDWTISKRVYEIREHHEKGVFNITGAIIPFIVVSCNYCSNTRFFNAIAMDIVRPQEVKEAENER